MDRTIKDLESQIERKDKHAVQLTDDAARLRDKVEKLLQTIDELQASESSNQLTARRAERELREERDKTLRLERELDGWKHLRMEKGSVNGGSLRTLGAPDGMKRMSTWRSSSTAVGPDGADDTSSLSGTGYEVPKRKGSLGRAPSLTKGFI